MESNCCNAKPYFALGYIHGIKMAENGKYYGLCGECREHTVFIKQNRKGKQWKVIAVMQNHISPLDMHME